MSPYTYIGNQLTYMTLGNNTLYFTYGATGTPQTVDFNGTTYYYITNIHGDVIGILDSDGNTVVLYTYDAWGNCHSEWETYNPIFHINPLRYRGYIFDEEMQLYYISSRYYSPDLGRWISADAFVSTGQGFTGNNMFVYCGNNPVMFSDPTGMRYEISAGCGGSIRSVTEEIMDALNRESVRISELPLKIKNDVTMLGLDIAGETGALIGGILGDFYLTVTHKAPWDIKRADPWEATIGTTFPGYGCLVYFDYVLMTPEMLGNFTYGYLGREYGLLLPVLYAGSYLAAGMPITDKDLDNELWDWEWIRKGYNYAYADSWN